MDFLVISMLLYHGTLFLVRLSQLYLIYIEKRVVYIRQNLYYHDRELHRENADILWRLPERRLYSILNAPQYYPSDLTIPAVLMGTACEF